MSSGAESSCLGITGLRARLEAQLKADSSTTGKPPSSDPIGPRKKRAERRAEARAEKRSGASSPVPLGRTCSAESRRRGGAQAGVCGSCGADLAGAQVVGKQVRQVIDLPPVAPVVTDHVSYRLRCSCGAETVADFPPEARAPVCFGPEVRAFATYLLDRQHLPVERTAELLEDLLGVRVSTGWLCAVQAEAAGRLTPFLAWLRDRLVKEPVVHADETGTAVVTTKHWVHTLTTKLLTLIAVHPKRGLRSPTTTSGCSPSMPAPSSTTATPPMTFSPGPPTPSAMFTPSGTSSP